MREITLQGLKFQMITLHFLSFCLDLSRASRNARNGPPYAFKSKQEKLAPELKLQSWSKVVEKAGGISSLHS